MSSPIVLVDNCAICQDSLGGNAFVKPFQCTHHFHASCISRMKTAATGTGSMSCPICSKAYAPNVLSVLAVMSEMPASSPHKVQRRSRSRASQRAPRVAPSLPPSWIVLLCCNRRGPYPDFVLLPDRRMAWAGSTEGNDFVCNECGNGRKLDDVAHLSALLGESCVIHGECAVMVDIRHGKTLMVCAKHQRTSDQSEINERCSATEAIRMFEGNGEFMIQRALAEVVRRNHNGRLVPPDQANGYAVPSSY